MKVYIMVSKEFISKFDSYISTLLTGWKVKKEAAHYAAGTMVNGVNVGGQFRPRDELGQVAFELGRHAAKGTTAPAALKAKLNRLRGIVETVHGRHAARSVYQEHYNRGLHHSNASHQHPPANPPHVANTPAATTQGNTSNVLQHTTVATPSTSTPTGIGATHAVQTIAAKRYEHTSNGHNKFWTIAVHGKHVVKHWGAIGTEGQKKTWEYNSPNEAQRQAALMTNAKRAGGYQFSTVSHITDNLPIINSPTQAVPTTHNIQLPTTQLPPHPAEVTIPHSEPSASATHSTGDSNDPHGLAALDTPSKIKNAYYDISHKYLSAKKSGDHQTMNALKDKAKAIEEHAKSKLTLAHQQEMLTKARNDVENGVYKLPFKAKSKNKLPLAAQSASMQAANQATDQAETTTQGTTAPATTEKEKITSELQKMWHQRGRNQADYDVTHIQTEAMRKLQEAAKEHEGKLMGLGVSSSHIANQRLEYINKGKAERNKELAKEKEVKDNLSTVAAMVGRLKTFGSGFGKPPVAQGVYDTTNNSLTEHFNKAAEVIGHDAATTLKHNYMKKGMEDGTADLQAQAKTALHDSAFKYGHALGYNGGFRGTPLTEVQHEANRKAMMDIHDKAKTILSEATLKSFTTDKVKEAEQTGKDKYDKEKTAYVTNISNKISELAHAKGGLEAVGKSLRDTKQAELDKHLEDLKGLIGESGAKMVYGSPYQAGKLKALDGLRESLRASAFTIGHHEGLNSSPSDAEHSALKNAYDSVKQHIGEEEANKIKGEAHAAGKADALDPKVTKEQVHKEMTDLGLDKFITADPKFGEHWAKQMPKCSPKEFFKGFFGEGDMDKSNLQKLQVCKFDNYGSLLRLYSSGSNLKLYGGRTERFERIFNFSDQHHHDCPGHYVEHAFLKIVKEDRDKGSTKKMFQALMGKGADGKCLYERMGMQGCHVHGALEGGGYVWPSFGFHYDSDHRKIEHQDQIKSRLKREINKIGGATDFDSLSKYVKTKAILLPNSDGSISRRALTAEDHEKIKSEYAAINKLLSIDAPITCGYDLTKLKTPMLNALHSISIADNDKMDQKRPTFVKQLMMADTNLSGTHMYGFIDFTDNNPQITEIRKNLFK